MQDDPSDELNVKMTHVKNTLADLADNRKGLGENGIQEFLLGLIKVFGRTLDPDRNGIFFFLARSPFIFFL